MRKDHSEFVLFLILPCHINVCSTCGLVFSLHEHQLRMLLGASLAKH